MLVVCCTTVESSGACVCVGVSESHYSIQSLHVAQYCDYMPPTEQHAQVLCCAVQVVLPVTQALPLWTLQSLQPWPLLEQWNPQEHTATPYHPL